MSKILERSFAAESEPPHFKPVPRHGIQYYSLNVWLTMPIRWLVYFEAQLSTAQHELRQIWLSVDVMEADNDDLDRMAEYAYRSVVRRRELLKVLTNQLITELPGVPKNALTCILSNWQVGHIIDRNRNPIFRN